MNYSCLHTHSTFCDGHDEIETLCEAAYQKGLVSIGFSAHAPLYRKTGFKTDWHLREDRLEVYLDTVRAARCHWEGKLRVFLGLEVDYIKGLIGPADQDFQELGLDYLIGSVHYILPPRDREPFTVDGPMEEFVEGLHRGFSGDVDALVAAYWDSVEAMIRNGGFDILGHLDLIKKNNSQEQWFSLTGESYVRRITGITELLGPSPVVEVNTGGLNRYNIADTYPSLPILQLLQKKQVPVIITADAHKAEHLGGHYEEARKILLRAGYTQAVLFEGHRNGNPVWIDDPLADNKGVE